MTAQLSIQQRARKFPCSCGAQPGEFCVNRWGGKLYTAHLDRLRQENNAWHRDHPERDTPATAEHPDLSRAAQ